MTPAPHNRPSAEFVDKHMIATVEGVMIHEYLSRKPGPAPSKRELGAFVSALSDDEVLRLIREHPGLRSVAANMPDDADVLRWTRSLK